jgi:hypothetical protein
VVRDTPSARDVWLTLRPLRSNSLRTSSPALRRRAEPSAGGVSAWLLSLLLLLLLLLPLPLLLLLPLLTLVGKTASRSAAVRACAWSLARQL